MAILPAGKGLALFFEFLMLFLAVFCGFHGGELA
jgi:hypothetical protein